MTHASVFSGIGGPEVAATMLGWENLFHCEINPFGRKVLDYWYPDSESNYSSMNSSDAQRNLAIRKHSKLSVLAPMMDRFQSLKMTH